MTLGSPLVVAAAATGSPKRGPDGRSPRMAAAAAGHIETVESLMRAGSDVIRADHGTCSASRREGGHPELTPGENAFDLSL